MPKLPSAEQAELRRLRSRAYRAQGGLCRWCGEPMAPGAPDSDPRQLTGDHLVPLYAGGRTVAGNVVAACRECNNARNDETNRGNGGLVATTGEPQTGSPFEALRALMEQKP